MVILLLLLLIDIYHNSSEVFNLRLSIVNS